MTDRAISSVNHSSLGSADAGHIHDSLRPFQKFPPNMDKKMSSQVKQRSMENGSVKLL